MTNLFARLFLLVICGAIGTSASLGQSAPPLPQPRVYSASSGWQKVTLKSETGTRRSNTGRTSPSTNFRPAFTGDFVTNRNHWQAGRVGDYYYQIGKGYYTIQKQNVRTKQVAFSSIALPQDINLNRAEIFTIKADVLADSGQIATGGLLFGVKDSLNFCAFTTNAKGEVSIKRVANGETFGDYMPGILFKPGVPIDKNRNRLMIKRRADYLYFYINEQEVRSSPYPFRMLSGNGIGFTSAGYWTSFQKLSVTVGL